MVPGESAIIGDPFENRETIHGDHVSIVKFSTKDDAGYKKVLNSIEMLLEGLETPSKQGVLKFDHYLHITIFKLLVLRIVKSDAAGLEEVSPTRPPSLAQILTGRI